MNNEAPLNLGQSIFLKKHLPVWTQAEALTYHRWQDRQAYLGGRYLLLEALKKLHLPVDLFNELKYTAYGRPYLPINIDFNISHSGRFIVLVISNEQRVGIDIEEIKKIEIEDFGNQFTDFELQKINKATNRYTEFFRYWTIKEAVIKADGRGMSMDLHRIRIDKHAHVNGKIWYVKEVKISTGYIAHIAADMFIPDDIGFDTVTIPDRL